MATAVEATDQSAAFRSVLSNNGISAGVENYDETLVANRAVGQAEAERDAAGAAFDAKLEALTRDIISETRVTLMTAFRFLDASLWHMALQSILTETASSTNGRVYFFNPNYVISQFMLTPNYLVRDYLHTLLHCIFHHPFDVAHVDDPLWDLACDIAVEAVSLEMCGNRYPIEKDQQRRRAITALEKHAEVLTPLRIYRVLGSAEASGHEHVRDVPSLWDLQIMFTRDNHGAWANRPQPDMPQNGSDDYMQDAQGEGEAPQDDEDFWRDISDQISADLATFSRAVSSEDSCLAANLSLANRKPCDYRDFIRQFAAMGEDMCVNDDEFDYIFYTYGLKRYGNIPLVEPLEYREDKRVREFVIAIDTSGSCSGELVRAFVLHTATLLGESGNFGQNLNIHVIQCDDHVRSDVKLCSAEEVSAYCKEMEVQGFGGTDFRPAFDYVADLLASGEFSNLHGLIYFTDGYGIFPSSPPPYEVAFVFVEDRGEERRIPPWAMKVVVTDEQVLAAQ